ncbi:helix-turn-helix transcriptional regulator [Stenotrophomonas maltophilia]|uniref:helix-turn-helix transcriptional regulator n=1 Tax=Stenotrophomonas maltophilia TaxID=40324 RepID=UPI00143234F1|nr:helix-turn-helix transcriptional regulator [Stenotrophomonas maltophilia]
MSSDGLGWSGVWARVSSECPACTCSCSKKPLCLLLALEPIDITLTASGRSVSRFLKRDSLIVVPEPSSVELTTEGGATLQVRIDHSIVMDAAQMLAIDSYRSIQPSVGIFDRSLALLLRSLKSAMGEPEDVSNIKAQLIGRSIAAHVLCMVGHGQVPSGSSAALESSELLRFRSFVEANVGSRIQDALLADFLGMSTSTLRRRFKATTGMTPREYIISERIRIAKKLLVETSMSIGDVAHACGFSDHSHLCVSFIQHLGMSPGDVRRGVD